MSFFNDLGKRISDVAGETAEKAKDLAETTKLKAEIGGIEKKIQAALLEIGKNYYLSQKDQPDSPIAAAVAEIGDLEKLLADIEQQISDIKAP